MADRYAVASGNWSNTATWDGGTLPAVDDVVRANGFTVTIDVSVTAVTIQTTALAPAVAGGKFILTNGITVTANLINQVPNSFEFNLGSPNSCTIIGSLNCNAINVGVCLLISSSGTVNIVGNLTSNINSPTVNLTASGGTLNLTGDALGNGAGGYGIQTTSASNINVVGQVFSGTINPSQGINVNGAANVTITGSLFANSNPALQLAGSACVVVVNGIMTSNASNPAINSTAITASVTVSGELINTGGVQAVSALRLFVGDSPTTWRFVKPDLTERMLYTADVLPAVPAIANVRQGTIYGPSAELTGTLAVPPVSAVGVGVPVDNTVGTAQLTAEDFLNAINTSVNPVATRLKNVSTVATTGGQITAFSS